ncbi:hypothetical protein HMPREF0758_1598 [Serratia odorifera DSM 4582]|uniref:Uncharacterized protein n=1 Tax=Serratia odorifera DSM 4582 TaxID=667129 RepID=D4E098_SEROD|nr:hypothetical protein HMPREF0758_1598 [Serratia odorifera DSM 4582]
MPAWQLWVERNQTAGFKIEIAFRHGEQCAIAIDQQPIREVWPAGVAERRGQCGADQQG